MSKLIKTLSVFGFDGVVASVGSSVSSAVPNGPVVSLIKDQLDDASTVVAFISSDVDSNHTQTRLWLQRNIPITAYPKPTFIFLRNHSTPTHVSASRHFSFLLGRFPALERIYCTDRDPALLTTYASLLSSKAGTVWRMLKVEDDGLHPFSSSLIDKI